MALERAESIETHVNGDEVIVAIPTLNEALHIEHCVSSLMDGDDRLTKVRFVVADGGSTDGTQDIVRELAPRFDNLELLHNENRLQSAAVNRVAEAAEAHRTILVRCDAHSIYPPGYVMKVADALRKSDAASLVVPMDSVGVGCFQKANAWIVNTPLGSGGSAHRGGCSSGPVDHGHHAGFDLSWFKNVGGYDEAFSHNEDAEYDRRVTSRGGVVFLDADIRVTYSPRATVRALARQYYKYGQGRAATVRKHRMRPKLRQIAPALHVVFLVASLILAVVTPLALVYPVFYVSVLIVASIQLAVSRRSVCGLLGGIAAATMHLAWETGFLLGLLRRSKSGRRPLAVGTDKLNSLAD